jgi:uncharacterized phage protein (predicted DNA packaging)
MAIVSLEEAKEYLRISHDEEDALILGLADRAQNHVERLLGYTITSEFGGVGQDPIPPALSEAVRQLAAWWYETRGMPAEEAGDVPYGIREIVTEYRDWTF